MTDNFTLAINRVLGAEGAYVDDPTDPGGETHWGISKRAYPNLDIKNLTRDQAIAIYRSDFWNALDGDALPFALAFQLLDGAVNSGIAQALRWAQRAAGVADDGHIGPVTLNAIKRTDVNDILLKFNGARLDYMTRLSNWSRNSAGWARRIAQNLIYAAGDN